MSQKFGVEEGEIHSALLSDDPHNALVIAYNLVIDNRRIESAKEKEETFEVDIVSTNCEVTTNQRPV